MQHPQKISEAGEVRLLQRDAGGELYAAAPIAFAFAPPIVHVCDTKWASCTTCADSSIKTAGPISPIARSRPGWQRKEATESIPAIASRRRPSRKWAACMPRSGEP